VHPNRRAPYASEAGLGQAFNFDLLASAWDAESFREIIEDNLQSAKETGSSSTWVMSNHDVIRHATRLVIPGYGSSPDGFSDENNWYVTHRMDHDLDMELGLARAKAATLLILGLPGSTYIYQGEELGLHDVLDIPSDQMQDPQWFRGEGKLKSRDGCRVPLPWAKAGSSFGFGPGGSHLPQPSWYSDSSVEAQENESSSTLNLYRKAIALRKELGTSDDLSWIDSPQGTTVFRRGNWIVATNFSDKPAELPTGEVILSSSGDESRLAPNSTVWLRAL
jgi:alpha-glucosidase